MPGRHFSMNVTLPDDDDDNDDDDNYDVDDDVTNRGNVCVILTLIVLYSNEHSCVGHFRTVLIIVIVVMIVKMVKIGIERHHLPAGVLLDLIRHYTAL